MGEIKLCTAEHPNGEASRHDYVTVKECPGYRKSECPNCGSQLTEAGEGIAGG